MNWNLITNSLKVSLCATALSLAFGFCTALWVQGLAEQWRTRFMVAAVATMALPPFLVTSCWMHLLGNAGVLRPFFPLSIYSIGGTVWILSLLYWPISFLLISGALSRLEASQWESDARLGGWPLIRWVLWPAARPLAKLAGILTFVLALNNFAVPALLQTKVFAAELWVSFNTTFNYREALILGLPLVAAPVLLLIQFTSGGAIVWPVYNSESSPRNLRRQLGSTWFFTTGILTLVIMILSLGLPIALLTGESRTWAELWPAFAAGKSALTNSLLFAVSTSTACVMLGILGWRWRLGWLLWIPFLVPGVLLGIALIRVFNQPFLTALYQSYGIVLIAFILRFCAISMNAAQKALQSLDPDLAADARLSGASGWRFFWHVQARQIAPQAAAAWYITYVLCLWDVETLVLIVPPGAETVALRIFNLLHYGHNSHVNALCLLLLVLAVLPLLVCGLARKLFDRRFISSIVSMQRLGLAMIVLTLGLAVGCARSESRGIPLDSDLFSAVEIIGSRGTGAGQFNKPRSVATDRMGNLYVVDMTGRVQKFSSNGVYLASLQMPQTDLGKPKGMCRDLDGNIIVIEPHYSRVNHFSPKLLPMAHWGRKGTNVGQLNLPRAAAVTSSGEIYVSEYGQAERIQKFTKEGTSSILHFGVRGSDSGEFNRPEGLGVDRNDRLYVADSCNHRIQVFGPNGAHLRSYGKPGSAPGEFSYPYDIRIDSMGIQYVCEFGNSRIQIFDDQDQLLEVLGHAGAEPGEFNNPWSIALDSEGNLYVADSRNHRVQKFHRRRPLTPESPSTQTTTPSQKTAS